jgi:Lipid A 3-O-deacylase (PagL)
MDAHNNLDARMLRNVMIGFVMAATLGAARESRAADAEIGVQAGPITTEQFGARGYAGWNATSWLNVEAGVLIVHEGAIFDVTPMFHSTGAFFVGAGIGYGYNNVQNDRQSEGSIFHDVFEVGYKATPRVTLRWDVQHWSNGGHYNPAFGTPANGGYTAFTFGVTYRL